MSNQHPAKRDRLRELLADQITHGLDPADVDELERLLVELGCEEQEALERAAAAIDLSFQAGIQDQELPAELAVRIRSAAVAHLPPAPSAPVPSPARPVRRLPNRMETFAWLAAAACLLLALAVWFPTRVQPLVQQREELLRAEADAVTLPWTATADPAAQGAGGDVVWSNRAQRGFMRFRGLASNHPGQNQYQLWIFDADRDQRYPIDGGVFDIDPTTGDVIVPITPKLRVARPVMFAVTVEKPGGVVVSSRERLPLLAKMPRSG